MLAASDPRLTVPASLPGALMRHALRPSIPSRPAFLVLAFAMLLPVACSDQQQALASCPPSGVIAEGEDHPWLLQASTTRLYWGTAQGVRSVPLAGGQASTIAKCSTMRSFAVHGDDVYIADYGALEIRRVRDRQETRWARANALRLATDEDYLYWVQSSEDNEIMLGAHEGSLARAPLAGGPVEVLQSALELPDGLAANGKAIFYAAGAPAGVFRRRPAMGSTEQVLDGDESEMAASEGGAYVVTQSWPSKLIFIPNDGVATQVASLPSRGVAATDATGVYVGTDTGRLVFVANGSSTVETLATDLGESPGIGGLAPVGNVVFAAVPSAGRIVCIDKGSPGAPQATAQCPSPIGDTADIASTPRADGPMELLALRLDQALVATQSTYDRLVADKEAIQALLPGVTVQYRHVNDGKRLSLHVTEQMGQAVQAGTFTAWSCLNDFYVAERVTAAYLSLTDDWWVDLELKGLYDTAALATLYAQLPGVLGAETVAPWGDGPTLCVSRAQGRYEYVVDDRRGDCPAGCIETTAYYFVGSTPGVVAQAGTWDDTSGEPAPPWYSICAGY